MVTFTINIPQMLAYIPYMDPMGKCKDIFKRTSARICPRTMLWIYGILWACCRSHFLPARPAFRRLSDARIAFDVEEPQGNKKSMQAGCQAISCSAPNLGGFENAQWRSAARLWMWRSLTLPGPMMVGVWRGRSQFLILFELMTVRISPESI